MNKRQLTRVTNLYRDGVSPEVCVSSIIEMSRTNTEAGVFICKFFNSTIINPLKQKAGKSFKYPVVTKIGGLYNEPPCGAATAELENQRPVEDQ